MCFFLGFFSISFVDECVFMCFLFFNKNVVNSDRVDWVCIVLDMVVVFDWSILSIKVLGCFLVLDLVKYIELFFLGFGLFLNFEGGFLEMFFCWLMLLFFNFLFLNLFILGVGVDLFKRYVNIDKY